MDSKTLNSYDVRVGDIVTTLREGDRLSIVYKNDKTFVTKVTGKLVKIGVKNNKVYFVVLDYMFSRKNNIHNFTEEDIVKIENVNRSKETVSFAPVYCADESVLLLRVGIDGDFEYTDDGKTWRTISGSSGGGEDKILNAIREAGYDMDVNELGEAIGFLASKCKELRELIDMKDDLKRFTESKTEILELAKNSKDIMIFKKINEE